MILYFSATGNCKYAAERIAQATADRAVSIENAAETIVLSPGETLGFVFPTYWWELPITMREYLENLTVTGARDGYVFVLATYGTTPGASGEDAAHLLRKKHISVHAKYSLQMPDTWTPIFDLSNAETVAAQNRRADAELETVIESIRARRTGNRMHRAMPYFVRTVTDFLYNRERCTKNLHAESSCIGCGLCAKKCPVGAIEMQNDRPVWVKEQCAMCLRCLHHCPKFAIQYQNKTQKHGQYRHPKAKV